MKKPLVFWVRFSLGAILVIASIDKIRHPAEFAQIIHNYEVLPEGVINLVAILLPWLELVLGCLLVFGVWLPGAIILTNVLLLTFFSILVFNVARGLDVNCGCFSTSTEGSPSTVWNLFRDAFFLLMSGYLLSKTVLARR